MTATRGLFVRQTGTAPNAIGTTPLEARLALAGLFAENSPGVPRSGILPQNAVNLVTASATDQSYNITGCVPVINRATNEGVYVFSLTGTTNAQSSNAPGTGSRFDLIYVRQHDPDKGDPDNLPEVGVVVGQSSTGTPTKPYASVPAGGYVIGEAQIFAGTTAANGGANTLTQVWVYTVPRGEPIPVRNTTERAAITPAVGGAVQRMDISPTAVETWNGSAWLMTGARKHAEFIGPAINAVANGETNAGALTADAVKTFNNSFVTPNATGLKFLEAGDYLIEFQILPASTHSNAITKISKHGSTDAAIGVAQSTGYGYNQCQAVGSFSAAVNDVLDFTYFINTAQAVGSRVRVTKQLGF